MGIRLALFVSFVASSGSAWASEPWDAVRGAVERGLPVVERAARNYPSHRRCFSCHHQTLPLLAHAEARAAGLDADDTLVEEQLDFTAKSFRRVQKRLANGERIGGRAATVTYGAWTFDLADVEPDDLTRDVVESLLRTQDDDGSWSPPSQRPPFMQSRVTLAVLAVEAFQRYGTEEQADRIAKATDRARTYLTEIEPVTQEDRNARLWGLVLLGFPDDEIEAAREVVLAGQHDDGGFSQLDGRSPDAYATGQTLWVLRYAGSEPTDPALQRAADFLLTTQEADGSWFVRTRVKPVQVYFDNGDPHGRSQFLAIPATAWAVAGLARMLPAVSSAAALPASGARDRGR